VKADSTYNLSSERVCSPEKTYGSHIVSHCVKLVGSQIEFFLPRPTRFCRGIIGICVFSSLSLTSCLFLGQFHGIEYGAGVNLEIAELPR
jgi:hypothetical protein